MGDSATASIGSGDNGVVDITVDKEGAIGNNYEVEVVDPEGNSESLAASLSGWTLTVSLATDTDGSILEDGSNSATNVATAVGNVSEFSAEASGTGADDLGVESAKDFTGGADVELFEAENDTVIDKIIAANVSGSAAKFSLSLVPVDGSVEYVNRIVEEKSVSANDTAEIEGPIYLEKGESLAGLQITEGAITLSITGKVKQVKNYN